MIGSRWLLKILLVVEATTLVKDLLWLAEFLAYLTTLRGVLPNQDDLYGSAMALLRLQDVYALSTAQMARGIVQDQPTAPVMTGNHRSVQGWGSNPLMTPSEIEGKGWKPLLPPTWWSEWGCVQNFLQCCVIEKTGRKGELYLDLALRGNLCYELVAMRVQSWNNFECKTVKIVRRCWMCLRNRPNGNCQLEPHTMQ